MQSTVRGIIFHTLPYSDNRLIAKIYTEDAGLESFIVSVSKSGRGKTRNSALQPLTLVEVIADRRDRNTLHSAKEISCYSPFTSMHDDIIKTSIALFVAELLYRTVREEEENQPLYTFLEHSLKILDLKHESVANFHLCFMLQLTRFLGFYPQLNAAGENNFLDLKGGVFRTVPPVHPAYVEQDSSRIISELMDLSYDRMHEYQLSGETRSKLVNHLLNYYELHLPSMQKVMSHQVLETVLS